MNSSNGNVIHTQGLSKAYKGVKVLDGLSLEVPKNSIFGFLGPNGAGKSTTIKLLLGLIRPSGGRAQAGRLPGPGPPLLRAHDRPSDAALHSVLLLPRSE